MKKVRNHHVHVQKVPLKNLFPESYMPINYTMAKSPHYQRTPEKCKSGSRESSPNFKPSSTLTSRARQNSASRHRSTSKNNSNHPLAQSGSTER